MMYILSTLSLIAGIIYLVVGISTYHLNKRSSIGNAFLLLTVSLAVWSFAYSQAYITDNIYIFSLWNKISAFGWCFFPALALYVILAITEDKLIDSPLGCLCLFAPAVFFWFTAVFLIPLGGIGSAGLYRFFNLTNPVYSYAYPFLGMVKLLLWYHRTHQAVVKKQVKIILIASFVAFILSGIGEFVLPYFVEGLLNFNQISSTVMILGIYYAIHKYNFLLTPNELIVNELFKETTDFEFLVNTEGVIIRVNRQVNNSLGYELEDFMSTTFDKLLKKGRENFKEHIGKNNTNTEHFQVSIRTKAEEEIPASISVVPIRSSGNNLILGYLIIAQDIRPMEELKKEIQSHRETVIKLRESEELFRTVAETIPYGIICAKKIDNTIFYSNQQAEALFQYDFSREETLITELLCKDKNFCEILFSTAVREGKAMNQEGTVRRKDGEFLAMVSMAPAVFKGEEVLLACIEDTTEQNKLKKNAVKSAEMLTKLMDSIPDLVLVTDIDGKINYYSKSIEDFLGYDLLNDPVPENASELLDSKAREEWDRSYTDRQHKEINILQTDFRKKSGEQRIAEVKISALRDEAGESFGFVFVARDITERRQEEMKLARKKAEVEKLNRQLLKSNELFKEKAVKDGLTNLYNHEYILEILKKEIELQETNPQGLAVMMLDIDHFKKVNDTYGHQTGDNVLKKITDIIQEAIRDTDYAGRYGGEEFIVILSGIQSDDYAYLIAERIKEHIGNCVFENKELRVTISIGLALYHRESIVELISRADKLLYQAKRNGRNRIETVDDGEEEIALGLS